MNVGIIDDHNLVRNAIKLLLKNDNINVTFEASNGQDMINLIQKKTTENQEIPDILIVDIHMPIMNGFETVSWLKINYPKIKVIVLTMTLNEVIVLNMIKLGIKSYLTKSVEAADIVHAIKIVAEGGVFFPEKVTKIMLNSIQGEGTFSSSDKIRSLTERELKLIKLFCSDLTYLEIAKKMELSPRTIDSYRDIIFSKLGVKGRIELVLFAVKNGLIHELAYSDN